MLRVRFHMASAGTRLLFHGSTGIACPQQPKERSVSDLSSGNPEPQPILHRAASNRAANPSSPVTPAAPTPIVDWCGRRHPAELILMASTVMAIILAIFGAF